MYTYLICGAWCVSRDLFNFMCRWSLLFLNKSTSSCHHVVERANIYSNFPKNFSDFSLQAVWCGENNGFFISGRIVWFLELTHHFHGDLQLLIENRISFKWFSSPRWAEWPMTITTLNWVLTAGLIGRLLRKYWKYGQQTKLNWMFYLFLIKIIFLFIYFCFIKNVKKRKLNKQLCIVVCYEHADLIGNSFLMN